MKSVMLIPILGVATIVASATWNEASACTPGPGQCCTSPAFRENGKLCRVTQCRGDGKFSTIETRKLCFPEVSTNVRIPRPHLQVGPRLGVGDSGGSTNY